MSIPDIKHLSGTYNVGSDAWVEKASDLYDIFPDGIRYLLSIGVNASEWHKIQECHGVFGDGLISICRLFRLYQEGGTFPGFGPEDGLRLVCKLYGWVE